jgi:hypothetical protein
MLHYLHVYGCVPGEFPLQLVKDWKALLDEGRNEEAAERKRDALERCETMLKMLDQAENKLNELIGAGRGVDRTLFEDIDEAKQKMLTVQEEVHAAFDM